MQCRRVEAQLPQAVLLKVYLPSTGPGSATVKTHAGGSQGSHAKKPKKFKVRQADKLQRLWDGLVAHFKIPADDSCWLLLPTRIGAGKVDLTRSSMSYGLVEGDELWLVNKKPAGF